MKKIFTISLVLLFALFPQIALAEEEEETPMSFSDLSEDHQYYNAIQDLVDKRILVGYEDGTFKPDQPVTRAEFLKMAIKYYNLYGFTDILAFTGTDCFSDTKDHWGESFICFAHEYEIVHGDEVDGLFHPERMVSLVEAAKIINYNTKAKNETDEVLWYQPSIDYLGEAQAIPTSVVDLKQEITRAEAAEMLWRTENEISPNIFFNTFSRDGELSSWESLGGYFSKKEGVIFDKESLVVSTDGENFQQIEDEDCGEFCPWRDSKALYIGPDVLSNEDLDNWDFLSENLVSDGENIRAFSSMGYGGIMDDVDAESFEVPENNVVFNDIIGLGNYLKVEYVKDKNNNYLLLSSDLFDGKGNLWREALEMEDTNLVFGRYSEGLAILTIPDSSGEPIEFIGKHHFTVGEKVYYLNNEIEEVDVESFDVYLEGEHLNWMQVYSRDAENLYYRGEVVEDADPDTFAETSSSWYYVDETSVYSGDGVRAEGSDSQTFDIMNNYYARDENHVYLYGYLVENADVDSFHHIDYRCSFDDDTYFLSAMSEDFRTHAFEATEEEWMEVCKPYELEITEVFVPL